MAAEPRTLGLRQWASVVGAYRWVELELFSRLGAWMQETPEDEVRLHFDIAAAEHAWHASLWEDRLPVLDGMDHDALTRPLGAPLERLGGALLDLGAPASAGSWPTVSRLAATYRVVLPRLLATYAEHLARTVAVTDAPTIRALKLVVRDELDSWQAGELLLQRVLVDERAVAAASAAQRQLEEALVEAGAGVGLLPPGGPGGGGGNGNC